MLIQYIFIKKIHICFIHIKWPKHYLVDVSLKKKIPGVCIQHVVTSLNFVPSNKSSKAQKSDLKVPTKEWTKVRRDRKNLTTRIIRTTRKRRPTRKSRRARKLLLALPLEPPAFFLTKFSFDRNNQRNWPEKTFENMTSQCNMRCSPLTSVSSPFANHSESWKCISSGKQINGQLHPRRSHHKTI